MLSSDCMVHSLNTLIIIIYNDISSFGSTASIHQQTIDKEYKDNDEALSRARLISISGE